jgi:hypothetical protein
MKLSRVGLINNLIKIYKSEEQSPEALHSYLLTQGIKIQWRALMNRWVRV